MKQKILTEKEYTEKENTQVGTSPIVNVFNIPKDALNRRYHVRYKYNKKHLFFDFIMLLLIAFLLVINVFLFFAAKDVFFNKTELTIDVGSLEKKSGSLMDIYINYNNNNKYTLENTVLGVTLPESFVIKTVNNESYNIDQNTIELGSIKPGGNGFVKITGQILGHLNDSQKIYAILSYDKQSSFNKEIYRYKKNTTNEFIIKNSVLSISGKLPSKLLYNQELEFVITLENKSEEKIQNIIIQKQGIPEFKILDGGAYYNIETQQWEIQELLENSIVDLPIKAKMESENQSNKSKQGDIEFLSIVDFQNTYLYQTSYKQQVSLEDPKIEAYILLKDNQLLMPDKESEFIIKITNNGTVDAQDLIITSALPKDFFQKQSIQTSAQIQDDSLIWNYQEIDTLILLQPGETKEVSFKVKVVSDISNLITDQTKRNFSTKLNGNISFSIPETGKRIEIEIPESEYKLGTIVSVDAYARYYSKDGEQIGRGPFPPIVDEPTKYWIFLNVKNTTNNVNNTHVYAKLPANVTYTGQHNSNTGELKIQADTLHWSIGQVRAYTGTHNTHANVSFEVEAVPHIGQESSFMPLLLDIKVQAIDEYTGANINKNIPNITTNLINDAKASQKGGKVIIWE